MQHAHTTQRFADKSAKQKIFLFVGILSCLVLAVNF